jgi:hypothetical protein
MYSQHEQYSLYSRSGVHSRNINARVSGSGYPVRGYGVLCPYKTHRVFVTSGYQPSLKEDPKAIVQKESDIRGDGVDPGASNQAQTTNAEQLSEPSPLTVTEAATEKDLKGAALKAREHPIKISKKEVDSLSEKNSPPRKKKKFHNLQTCD